MTTIPTLHLNGTDATTLLDEYAAANDALDKAIEAFDNTTCNGRDFYPQGPGAYDQARAERTEALNKLCEAQSYIGQVLMGICDQM
jgi:hypothetical protein